MDIKLEMLGKNGKIVGLLNHDAQKLSSKFPRRSWIELRDIRGAMLVAAIGSSAPFRYSVDLCTAHLDMDDLLNMEHDIPPLEELELIRHQLTQQIAEAKQMFSVENNGHELRTSKAALKCIKEAIKRTRQREVA